MSELNENVCPSIRSLANDMQYKLDKNERKPCPEMCKHGGERRWDRCDTNWLISRIKDEIEELYEELSKGDLREAQLECADIANFAMMVHDNLSRKLESE